MKTLLLLRHAKSSRDNPLLADFDRPLAPRGERDAPRMGLALAARRWLPDHALVSPALRTRQTWALVAAQLPAPPAVRFAETLYGATAEKLLAEVRRTTDGVNTLIVVGHNPGLEELAAMLAGDGSDPVALALLREKFPTGAAARFRFDGGWASLTAARLVELLRPADLG